MRTFTFLALLLPQALFAQRYVYRCTLTSFTPGETVRKEFAFTAPGTSSVITLKGSTAKIFSNADGLLRIRLGLEKSDFPYSNSVGVEFPKTLRGLLATARGEASSVDCERRK